MPVREPENESTPAASPASKRQIAEESFIREWKTVCSDVTELKLAEQRRSERETKDAQQRYRESVEAQARKKVRRRIYAVAGVLALPAIGGLFAWVRGSMQDVGRDQASRTAQQVVDKLEPRIGALVQQDQTLAKRVEEVNTDLQVKLASRPLPRAVDLVTAVRQSTQSAEPARQQPTKPNGTGGSEERPADYGF